MKKETREFLWGKKNMTIIEKIRALALWLIIFIVLMASLKVLYFSGDNSSKSFEDAQERQVRGILKDRNYEVIFIHHYTRDEGWSSESVILHMKSFGRIRDQVDEAFFTLSYIYPDIEEYSVTIFTPDKTCFYSTLNIMYNSYKKVLNGEKVYVDENGRLEGWDFNSLVKEIEAEQGYPLNLSGYPEISGPTLRRILNYQMNDPAKCS